MAPFLPARASGNGQAGSVFESAFYFNGAPRAGRGFTPGDIINDLVNPGVELVNINNATRDQLMSLPNVGPTLADAIIAARPYRDANDLRRVSGLSRARIAALSDRITFG